MHGSREALVLLLLSVQAFTRPATRLATPRARPPAPPRGSLCPQFFSDFASAFSKLLELGVPFKEGAQYV